jgi:MoxR-like ATPase
MPIEETARAIREAEERRRLLLEEQRRLRHPVEQVDRILQQLEEIHLRGGIKVPAAMIERIEHLLQELPADCRMEFPLRTTIVRVMDNLYAIQDRLLSRKDSNRRRLQVEDHELDRGDSSAA